MKKYIALKDMFLWKKGEIKDMPLERGLSLGINSRKSYDDDFHEDVSSDPRLFISHHVIDAMIKDGWIKEYKPPIYGAHLNLDEGWVKFHLSESINSIQVEEIMKMINDYLKTQSNK